MALKTPCNEAAVARQYAAGVPIASIRARHGISQNRLYGILRDRGLVARKPRREKDRAVVVAKDQEAAECGCCHEMFQPYTVDGQRCNRLCRACWERYGRARRAFAAEVMEERCGHGSP